MVRRYRSRRLSPEFEAEARRMAGASEGARETQLNAVLTEALRMLEEPMSVPETFTPLR